MQLKRHLLYISSKIQELTKSNNPNTGPLEVMPQKKKPSLLKSFRKAIDC